MHFALWLQFLLWAGNCQSTSKNFATTFYDSAYLLFEKTLLSLLFSCRFGRQIVHSLFHTIHCMSEIGSEC